MKKIFLILALLACFSSYTDLSSEQIAKRTLKALSFEAQKNEMVAHILLSDDTLWQGKCSFSDELMFQSWTIDDEIYIFTENKDGFCLENVNQRSCFQAFPRKESMNLFLTINRIEVIPAGWFTPAKYCIHLSDGSAWRVWLSYKMSYRWKENQRVLISKSYVGTYLVNLQLQYDSKHLDDRTQSVSLN